MLRDAVHSTALFEFFQRLFERGTPVVQIGWNASQDDLLIGNCILLVSHGGVASGQSQGSPEFRFRMLALVYRKDFHGFGVLSILEQAHAVCINRVGIGNLFE